MLGWPELLVIGGVVFLFVGPSKLPEVARSLGQGIKEFKKATQEGIDEIAHHTPQPSVTVCPACQNPVTDAKAMFCPKCGKSLNPPPVASN